jgi:hypothetical protein
VYCLWSSCFTAALLGDKSPLFPIPIGEAPVAYDGVPILLESLFPCYTLYLPTSNNIQPPLSHCENSFLIAILYSTTPFLRTSPGDLPSFPLPFAAPASPPYYRNLYPLRHIPYICLHFFLCAFSP